MKATAKTKKTTKARRSKYSEEFRAGALRLLAEGRSAAMVAEDLGVHVSTIHYWARQARVDAGEGPPEALTTDERQELAALRKENRVLKMEREILKKATAFFAKENA
jgi:transposase